MISSPYAPPMFLISWMLMVCARLLVVSSRLLTVCLLVDAKLLTDWYVVARDCFCEKLLACGKNDTQFGVHCLLSTVACLVAISSTKHQYVRV
jgi:hypothetical protein